MIIRKGQVYAVLSQLCRTIDRYASISALHHVKLEADGTTLHVEATDLLSHTVATIPCDGKFAACLPAHALAQFIKPEDAKDKHSVVELLPDGDDKVTVACEAALTTMASLAVTDFPRRPGDKLGANEWRGAATWRVSDFADALAWISLAVGTDETRPHLSGVQFSSEQIAGLDGHRLHLARMPGLGSETTLLPGRSIAALLRLLPKSGDVAALRAKDSVRFRCATGDVHWELEAQAMTEQFPPIENVIPTEGTETFLAEVEREALVRGIARVGKVKDRRHVGVRIIANGALRLERDGDDGAIASSTVPVLRTTHEGADTIIGVSAAYLADALACPVPVVTARFGGQLDPIRIDLGRDRTAVVMPMRL